MTQERVHTALRKKAEAGRPAPDSAPMTPERAVSQALAKVAEEQLSLPVQIKSCRETRMSLADLPEDSAHMVFHAGTALRDGKLVATGGRVLNVTARGETLRAAQEEAYALIDRIDWPEGFFRHDIGWRAL